MTIELHGILLHGFHGVLEEERRQGQRFLVDVELDLAHEEAARSDRIDENQYGFCEECGVKIPRARLKVMPFAKYCVECKEAIEREERYTREEPEEGIKKVPMGETEE